MGTNENFPDGDVAPDLELVEELTEEQQTILEQEIEDSKTRHPAGQVDKQKEGGRHVQ